MNAQEALRNEYGKGIADGIIMTLRMLLGETTSGGIPYSKPLPPELERWVRDALARTEEQTS